MYELDGRMVGYVRSRKTTGQWHTRMRQTSRASGFCKSSGSLGWTDGGPGLWDVVIQLVGTIEALSEEVCMTTDAHARRLQT